MAKADPFATRMIRVVGISNGAADLENLDARFTFNSEKGPMSFVANLGAANQIVAALGSIASALRAEARQSTAVFPTAAEKIVESHVVAERFEGLVMIQLVTDRGVPHTFALPPQAAIQIANHLKREAQRAKRARPGRG